jgi:iron complex outermembrane receptor protein
MYTSESFAQQDGPDAFGSRVGVESLGLYSETQVRGFNLQEAGNYLIDGAYFVRAAGPADVILRSLQIKVGPSALDLDFPAPSGVVAYTLMPGDEDRATLEIGMQHLEDTNPRPYMRAFMTRRTSGGRASLAGGLIAAESARYIYGNEARYLGAGIVPRFELDSRWNLTMFSSAYDQRYEADAGFVPAADHALPRLARLEYAGQKWSRFQTRNENHGAILSTRTTENAWDFSLSSILSKIDRPRSDFNIFRNVRQDGTADASVIVALDRKAVSWAHEVKASRDWTSDAHRTELTVLGRYRDSAYQDPLTQSFEIGRVSLLQGTPQLARPELSFTGDHGRSGIEQHEAGMSLRYAHRSGWMVNLGTRRVSVNEESRSAGGISMTRTSSRWLYNGSVVIPIRDSFAAFITTTRGIEEAGTAPQTAANRYEVLAPVIAEQSEFGMYWRPSDRVTAIATLFEIEKPEPGFDADDIYRYLTNVRHRGMEASVTAQVTEPLSVVLGGMWMSADLSGELVDSGVVGKHPVGRPVRLGWISFEHRLPWPLGLSIDADAFYSGPRFATADNRIETPGYIMANIGARYRFEVSEMPATLRLRIYNATDRYAWDPSSSGVYGYEPERRVNLSVTIGMGPAP